MSELLARIELRKTNGVEPSGKVYDILHAAADAVKLVPFVTVDGVKYRLPTGTYYGSADISASELHQRASRAAQATGFKHSIIVATATEVRFSGLDVMNPDPPTLESLLAATLKRR